MVAQAIYDSQIPVISAVGHEPDVTIADFVADLRAATPSNAAELAVLDQNEVYAALQGSAQRLEQAMEQRLLRSRQHLERLGKSRMLTDPKAYVQDKRVLLDYQSRRMSQGMANLLAGKRARTGQLAAALDAMSPLKVLGRGYAIAQKEDGGVIAHTGDAAPGERFRLRVSDGELPCRVEETDDRDTAR